MLLLPFVVQTAIIRTLGSEYNGLRGVFSSILQVLNLAELGFGNALVFGMYKPIADDDLPSICALLNLYRKLYKWIGIIVFTIGCSLIPFLPILIKDNYTSEINLTILFILNLFNTALSYWLWAYKYSLFNAFQRVDIINTISTVVYSIAYGMQIFVIVYLKNFYLYTLVTVFATIANNLVLSAMADKMYPEYKCYGTVSKEFLVGLRKKVKGLFLYKICGTSRNSFDNIFLSAFMGLTVVGMYNNYYYILISVSGIMSIISTSLLAGVGNSIVSESIEKNYQDMKRLNYIYMLITGWSATFMICLYQSFMRIWVGEKLMFTPSVAVLFTIYFYVLKMGDIRGVYSDAKGLWWENRNRTVIEAIMNIILNFIFVQIWGVNGVIIATILSLFIFGFIGGAIILFKYYFKSGLIEFFKEQGMYFIVSFFVCLVTVAICELFNFNSMMDVALKFLICCIVPPILYYLVYHRTKIFKTTMNWVFLRIRRT